MLKSTKQEIDRQSCYNLSKPTDEMLCLNSSGPKHLRNAIPFSQLLRIEGIGARLRCTAEPFGTGQ